MHFLAELEQLCACDDDIDDMHPDQPRTKCIYCESRDRHQTLLAEGVNLARDNAMLRGQLADEKRKSSSLYADLSRSQSERTRYQQQCVVQKAQLEKLVESVEIVRKAMAAKVEDRPT